MTSGGMWFMAKSPHQDLLLSAGFLAPITGTVQQLGAPSCKPGDPQTTVTPRFCPSLSSEHLYSRHVPHSNKLKSLDFCTLPFLILCDSFSKQVPSLLRHL